MDQNKRQVYSQDASYGPERFNSKHTPQAREEFTNHKSDRVGVGDLEDSFVFVFQELGSSRTIGFVVTVLEAETAKDRTGFG